MKAAQSEWQSKALSKAFIEGVRGAIPGADLQFAVIAKIARLWCCNPNSILDLGCGDGILGRLLLTLFPSAHTHFIDFSEPMLEAARKNLRSVPNTTISQADFSTPQWLDCVSESQPFDIVISGYAIHHQTDERKRAIYAEIFDLLAADGVFLNLEHVSSGTEAGKGLFDDFFLDHLYEFHEGSDSSMKREDIAKTYYNRPDKKENILAPVDKQCRWLDKIGFIDVDCFFKVFEIALFGGRKAPRYGSAIHK